MTLARESNSLMNRQRNGTGKRQNKGMQMHNSIWELCTKTAKVSNNPMKRQRNGLEKQQNRELQMLNTI